MTIKKLKNKKKSYIPNDPNFLEQVTPNTYIIFLALFSSIDDRSPSQDYDGIDNFELNILLII